MLRSILVAIGWKLTFLGQVEKIPESIFYPASERGEIFSPELWELAAAAAAKLINIGRHTRPEKNKDGI